MKNSFIYTVIFTFILCFLFVFILSFIDEFTEEKIQNNRVFEQRRAVLLALGAQNVETLEEVNQKFQSVTTEEIGDSTYYKANFNRPSVAKRFSGPGLWGLISGYIAMSDDLDYVVGFEVTDQNETPGLGGRIGEAWFNAQLKNEKIENNNIIVGSGGTGDSDKENGYIDGITGATRTSEGIQQILTKEISLFKTELGR